MTTNDSETDVDVNQIEMSRPQAWIAAKSVDTFTPYTSARVRRHFKATVDDELSVQSDETLVALYREDDWIYVSGAIDGTHGFIPVDNCDLLVGTPKKTIRQRAKSLLRRHGSHLPLLSGNNNNWSLIPEDKHPDGTIEFTRIPTSDHHPVRVLHSFCARTDDELTVQESQLVIPINSNDPDWIFVRNESEQEGFVPRCYIDATSLSKSTIGCCELLVTRRFVAECAHDLSIAPGDWLLLIGWSTLDDATQAMGDWIWVRRNERNSDEGFVPSGCVTLATVL